MRNYRAKQYNLDVIIPVGYQVKSQRSIEFRRWAMDVLCASLKQTWQRFLRGYSHSIVAGDFEVMSYTTRFTPGTSATMRPEIFARTS